MDDFLKSYVTKYDRWRQEGTFSFSSKVIPVNESFSPSQWILPSDQVLQILKAAESFALTDCICRTHYSRCDKPKEVCFPLNKRSDQYVEHNKARRISLADASEVLKEADKHGLVHLTLYMPGHSIYAICSCCPCCCHDLQLLINYRRADLVMRSDYVAATDRERCIDCGKCIDRCVFGARFMKDNKLAYNARDCFGCGLCVSVCPKNATIIAQKDTFANIGML